MQNTNNIFDWSNIAGYWGAILSTFLAIRAIYLDRIKIHAHLDLSHDTDGFFSVKITNISRQPIVINYYNFFLNTKSKGHIDVGLYENCHITFAPFKVQSIYLSPMYENDFKGHGKLYLELYITGRSRPKKILVKT